MVAATTPRKRPPAKKAQEEYFEAYSYDNMFGGKARDEDMEAGAKSDRAGASSSGGSRGTQAASAGGGGRHRRRGAAAAAHSDWDEGWEEYEEPVASAA